MVNMFDFCSELQKLYGFARVTLYAISPNFMQTFQKGVPKDKQKMVHIQKYQDRMTNLESNIVAVCRQN